MSTEKRKLKERQAREQLFLDAAREIIRGQGLLGLQMARVASACDYATGTLYQHFRSREDLLVALATQRTREHSRLFQKAAEWSTGTRDRMFALAVIDRDFCHRHPGHTRLVQYVFTEVVWSSASQERRQDLLEACQPCIEALGQIVDDATGSGDLDTASTPGLDLAVGPWALCHGMQSLERIEGLQDSAGIRINDDLLYLHVDSLLNGIGWQPLTDLTDRDNRADRVRRVQEQLIQTSTEP